MITIAVASNDPAHRRSYRNLLSAAGFSGHLVTDVPSLVRCVKSRPVDVVIFDVSPKSLKVSDWLNLIATDDDLGLVPVLWVGSAIPPSQVAEIESHRPGMYLRRVTDASVLKDAVRRLIGIQTVSGDPNNLALGAESVDWSPVNNSIDNALSIFAEPDSSRAHDAPPGRALREPEDPAFVEGLVPESRIVRNRSGESSLAPKPPDSPVPELGQGLTINVQELGTLPVPIMENRRTSPSQPGRSPGGKDLSSPDRLGEESEQFIETVVATVAARLADEIARRIDRDSIRRVVRSVLAENHGT